MRVLDFDTDTVSVVFADAPDDMAVKLYRGDVLTIDVPPPDARLWGEWGWTE